MPPFNPAQPGPPKSYVAVPFAFRSREQPVEEDKNKRKGMGVLMWQRHLPYKMVQGSHIGHGIKMEPSRKEPKDWKDPKRRLRLNNVGGGVENRAPQMNSGRGGGAAKPAAAATKKAAPKKAPARKPANNENRPPNNNGPARPPAAKGLAGRGAGAGGRAAAAPAAGGQAAAAVRPAAVVPPVPAPPPPPPPPAALPTPPETVAVVTEEPKMMNLEEAAKMVSKLQNRVGEVECLLRVELSDKPALQKARSGVADALALNDELAVRWHSSCGSARARELI